MHAVVPLKATAATKGRLAQLLTPSERIGLAEAMARDVLAGLTADPGLDGVTVCGPRPAAGLALAAGAAFIAEPEPEGVGLNAAIAHAAAQLSARGVDDIVVVHGDLPLLDASDIAAFIDAHRRQRHRFQVTLCPDQHGTGTNILAWRPIGDFSPSFGPDSFARHCAQAKAAGAHFTVKNIPVGRFDIDEPADLMALLKRPKGGRARHSLAFLQSSGIAARLLAMLPDLPGEDSGF